MKTIIHTFTMAYLLALPALAEATDRFVAGRALPEERFGAEGAILLAAGCLAVVGIHLLLIAAGRRHRQVASLLDGVASLLERRGGESDEP